MWFGNWAVFENIVWRLRHEQRVRIAVEEAEIDQDERRENIDENFVKKAKEEVGENCGQKEKEGRARGLDRETNQCPGRS